MLSYRDRIKMSIMTTRSKTNKTPTLGGTIDSDGNRAAISGLNKNRNAYALKKQLILAQKKGLHSLPSMTSERPIKNGSELDQVADK